jgi:hypothetical protein
MARKTAVLVAALGFVVALAASPAWAEERKEVDITGHYSWEGMKNGESYRISKNGEVYQVLWKLQAGTWIGVALRDGDRLAVAWDKPNGGNLGVAVYKIEKGAKGPALVGRWAAYQDKQSTKDTYTWSKKLD